MAKLAEHFDPIGVDSYLAHQHIDRYRFARAYIRPGDDVLDIACGSGYGTMIMREAGVRVIGCDMDEGLVGELNKRWACDAFRCADALALPFPDNTFNAVVSFETIEHVPDGTGFLSEMKRVLKPGGVFIGSTPNIRYTAHPAFHVKEYRPEEFFRLVAAHFPHGDRFGQYFRPTDRVHDLYHWHYLSHLQRFAPVKRIVVWFLEHVVRGAEAIGRRLRRTDGQASAPRTVPLNRDEEIKRICQSAASPVYGVRIYAGAAWLRIMVAVARKDR